MTDATLPPGTDTRDLETVCVRYARRDLSMVLRMVSHLRTVLPEGDSRDRYGELLADLEKCDLFLDGLSERLER